MEMYQVWIIEQASYVQRRSKELILKPESRCSGHNYRCSRIHGRAETENGLPSLRESVLVVCSHRWRGLRICVILSARRFHRCESSDTKFAAREKQTNKQTKQKQREMNNDVAGHHVYMIKIIWVHCG